MTTLVTAGLIVAVVLLWRRQNAQKAEIESLQLELNALSLREDERRNPADSDDAIGRPVDDTPVADDDTERRAWMGKSGLEARYVAAASETSRPLPEPSPEPRLHFDDPEGRKATADDLFVVREEPDEPPRPHFDFEDIFGRRLPIWAGGIALAIAGIFLVRFSIEAGLLTPAVRAAASFAFGLVLLALAETAYRFERRLADPRVRQALAGAGLATLYAAFYLAGTRYGLIGAGTAFFGLAAVTAGAIALTFRYGLPSVLLGLVGGFAAPALVASDEAHVPVLTIYLALVAAGLAWTGVRIGKPWLGFVALAGGFGWGAVLLAAELASDADRAALGLLLVVLGVAIPIIAERDTAWRWPRLGAAGLASLQMALLIGIAGYDLLTWGLYLLLAAALAVLGWREAFLREASAFAAALGLCLLALWDPPSLATYAGIAAALALVFIGVPFALLLRGKAREIDLWLIAGVALALAFVNRTQWDLWRDLERPLRALPDLALALPVALALRHVWRKREDWHVELGLLASAALLVTLANWTLAPTWTAPLAVTPVGLAMAWFAGRRSEIQFTWLACLSAALGAASLAAGMDSTGELARLVGLDGDTASARAALRWLAVALPFAAVAAIARVRDLRRGTEAAAMLFAYGAAVQVLPNPAIPAALAAATLALAWRLPRRDGGTATAALLLAAWSALPLSQWIAEGAATWVTGPVFVDDLPRPALVLERFVPLILGAIAVARLGQRREPRTATAIGAVVRLVALAGAHILYKQLFAIDGIAVFEARGMAERTLWQALLLGSGAALLARARAAWMELLGLALAASSIAHFALYSLALHNPLWSEQAVGAMPVANLILPAYALAIGGVLILKRRLAGGAPRRAIVADGAIMVLVLLFAISELRHAFSGSDLTAAPLGQAEDLLRSVLGIALAVGFLLWGGRTGQRHWRIGSLVLMLLAVGKVFLLDAAGLEGLLRIASFLALGVSLIAIGWLYSRQMSPARSGRKG
jgi:uncharacterized membrane protein